ncbi:hypothetical protein GEMRC1_007920 [Eukaryota sp. GEM-RC1]
MQHITSHLTLSSHDAAQRKRKQREDAAKQQHDSTSQSTSKPSTNIPTVGPILKTRPRTRQDETLRLHVFENDKIGYELKFVNLNDRTTWWNETEKYRQYYEQATNRKPTPDDIYRLYHEYFVPKYANMLYEEGRPYVRPINNDIFRRWHANPLHQNWLDLNDSQNKANLDWYYNHLDKEYGPNTGKNHSLVLQKGGSSDVSPDHFVVRIYPGNAKSLPVDPAEVADDGEYLAKALTFGKFNPNDALVKLGPDQTQETIVYDLETQSYTTTLKKPAYCSNSLNTIFTSVEDEDLNSTPITNNDHIRLQNLIKYNVIGDENPKLLKHSNITYNDICEHVGEDLLQNPNVVQTLENTKTCSQLFCANWMKTLIDCDLDDSSLRALKNDIRVAKESYDQIASLQDLDSRHVDVLYQDLKVLYEVIVRISMGQHIDGLDHQIAEIIQKANNPHFMQYQLYRRYLNSLKRFLINFYRQGIDDSFAVSNFYDQDSFRYFGGRIGGRRPRIVDDILNTDFGESNLDDVFVPSLYGGHSQAEELNLFRDDLLGTIEEMLGRYVHGDIFSKDIGQINNQMGDLNNQIGALDNVIAGIIKFFNNTLAPMISRSSGYYKFTDFPTQQKLAQLEEKVQKITHNQIFFSSILYLFCCCSC